MRLLFFLICVFSGSVIHAQVSTVSGRVEDASSGEPVNGVRVSLLNASGMAISSAFSDYEGRFSLSTGSLGQGLIRLSHVAFLDTTIHWSGAKSMVVIGLQPRHFVVREAELRGIRADRFTPATFTNLNKKDLEERNYGQDIPFLLNLTPGVVSHSDAGAGIGYTGMRIRGVDPTRTNVTINGIPYNDPESQGVFWVNLPDLASSASSIQIQRGVGTSSNGTAAFGASINIRTDDHQEHAFAQVSTGYGSFNTQRAMVRFGTGRLENNWSFTGRLSSITSDGFIDRSQSDLKSFFFSMNHRAERSSFTANVFSGRERTYQAWYGIPEPKLKGNEEGVERFISQLWMDDQDASHLRSSSNRTYNYYTYPGETDNYTQDHYQLFYNYQINKQWGINAALHYTYGRGYYEQYRRDASLDAVGIGPVVSGSDTLLSSDYVRQLWLDNHFYGAMVNLFYRHNHWNITWGNSANQYKGDHYGLVVWSRFAGLTEPNHRFYLNTGTKNEYNTFLKAGKSLGNWNLYADLQLRMLSYAFEGPNRFGTYLPQELSFVFFNPKAGAVYLKNDDRYYLTLALSNREPVRDDLVNASPEQWPRPERLYNAEAGWRRENQRYVLGVNTYIMYYQDQLVLTGKINDVGAYTRINVDRSYRAGLEADGTLSLGRKWAIGANLALSDNRVLDFTEYVDDWDNGGQLSIEHGKSHLALSPALVTAQNLEFRPIKNLRVQLISKYVSRQYLDNSSSRERSLNPFWVQDALIEYIIEGKKNFKRLEMGLMLNNLSNRIYAPNGYTFGGIINGRRESFNYLYPQAGTNYLLRLNLLF